VPFTLFGAQHLAALAVVAAACLLAARRARGPRSPLLALALAAYVVASYVAFYRNGLLSLEYALPLHLCNIAVGLLIVACLAPRQGLFEVCYYWGMGGTVQGLLTPDLAIGFPSWDCFQFFLGHGLVLVAVSHMLGAGLCPGRGSALRAFGWINVYALVVGLIDWRFGWNYGYLMRKPPGSSLLDALGPWPWYVLGMEAVALVTFLLLEWPWRTRRQERQ